MSWEQAKQEMLKGKYVGIRDAIEHEVLGIEDGKIMMYSTHMLLEGVGIGEIAEIERFRHGILDSDDWEVLEMGGALK